MKPSCPKEEEIPEENPDNNIPNVDDMHRPVMTDTTQDEERAAHLAAIEKEEKVNSTWMDKMDDNDNGEFTRCMTDGYGSSKEPPGTTMKHLRYTAKDLVATVPNDTDMKAQLAGKKREHANSSSDENHHERRNRLEPEPNLAKARKAKTGQTPQSENKTL